LLDPGGELFDPGGVGLVAAGVIGLLGGEELADARETDARDEDRDPALGRLVVGEPAAPLGAGEEPRFAIDHDVAGVAAGGGYHVDPVRDAGGGAAEGLAAVEDPLRGGPGLPPTATRDDGPPAPRGHGKRGAGGAGG